MLDKIFTKKNIEILKLLKKQELHIRGIANKLNCSPGKVHSTLKLFQKHNLVKVQKQKNTKIFILNRENPLLKKIISIINLNSLLKLKNFKKLSKHGTIGIYGSFASGTDDINSDLDIWIFTDKSLLQLQSLITALEKELKAKANLLILNKNKLILLKQKDYEFYIRLKLTSIIFGDDIFD